MNYGETPRLITLRASTPPEQTEELIPVRLTQMKV